MRGCGALGATKLAVRASFVKDKRQDFQLSTLFGRNRGLGAPDFHPPALPGQSRCEAGRGVGVGFS
jgi:hypothetical protein